MLIGEVVVVRGEEPTAARSRRQVLQHGTRHSGAVQGGGAATQLVQGDQRAMQAERRGGSPAGSHGRSSGDDLKLNHSNIHLKVHHNAATPCADMHIVRGLWAHLPMTIFPSSSCTTPTEHSIGSLGGLPTCIYPKGWRQRSPL